MSIKVVVADDNKVNSGLLEDILQDEGYMVHIADDGITALDMIREIHPDIVMLDIMMPKLDGFDVCRILKKDFDLKDIPVIMVTAKSDGADVKKALDIGAFDYIKKPADKVEVIARVQSAIRFKKYQDKLKEMSMKDGLTGVYNHALLMELFEKEYSRCKRANKSISFVMFAIDYFKKVNDTYGHFVGDVILRDVASILAKSVRMSDTVGRYGGEEFGIVLPEIDLETTYNVCERIRKSVEEYNFYADNNTVRTTISIGICHKDTGSAIQSVEMVKRADDALYQAKRNGRNRIEICNG